MLYVGYGMGEGGLINVASAIRPSVRLSVVGIW